MPARCQYIDFVYLRTPGVYLMTRKHEGIGEDDILSSSSCKDDDFSDIVRRERITAATC